jgi:geranylgeranyl diphosphate synthase type II
MKVARFERRYAHLQRLINTKLASFVTQGGPKDLTAGSRYVLTATGKRVRSTLVLLSCEAVGGRTKDALHAAAAIEMMHNFTLVHDDVMDNATSRRGRATVHTKWNVNNAILVGDVILGLAYRSLLKSRTKVIHRAAQLLTDGFIDVCKGQAFDLEYERRTDITLQEYYRMIRKKTGALIATATELGAVLGNGTPKQARSLRTFGARIGRAFQIQDDLLDVIADERDFGKKIGADIVDGKKTFLLVQALKRTHGKDRAFLRTLMKARAKPAGTRGRHTLVEKVTAIYRACGTIEAARKQIKIETDAGIRALQSLPSSDAREMLQWFSEKLVQRTF